MIELTFAIAAAGLAVAGWAAWQIARRTINTAAAIAALRKMIDQRLTSRMIKLCHAAPGTFLDAVREGLQAAVRIRSTDRVVLAAEVDAAFDAKAGELVAAAKRFGAIGLFGSGMLVASCGLALNDGVLHPVHYAAAIVGAAFAVYFVVKPPAFVAQAALYRGEVMARIVEGFATGALAPDDAVSAPDKATPPTAVSPSIPPRVTLRLVRDGVEISTTTFDEPVIKLGRQATAQVVLDDDRVARMHAIIERTDDTLQIIDLGSSAGTQVNGAPVTKHDLVVGDVITIGPFTLTLVDRAGAGAVPPARPPAATPSTTPPMGRAPSLRDGRCPICAATEIKSVTRTDTRFTALVCAGCGYTQEFADLTKLA